MSQTVTLNGVSYTVPDPDDTGWGTYTTSYLTAIASNMLQKNGGSFALTNDADFGSTKGLIAAYFKSASSNIADAGAIRLSNTDDIGFRNAGNDGNLLLSADASTDGILTYNSVALATISATQTLTNKTLTSPVINTGISGTAIDNNTSLGSSATKVPTQNAVKSYVDAQLTASDLDFQGDTGGAQSVDLDSQTLTVEGGTGVDTTGSAQKVSIAIDSTVATLTGTQTLTNKTINSPKINEDVALTATSTYLNRMDATSSVQTQLNAKQATITGAATTIASSDLTASKALQSNASGKVEVSSVTTAELAHVSGVTSAIQTQLNAKQATIDTSNRLDADLIHDGTVSNTEFGYINSLTSNAQTQLDAKAPISQPEFTSYVDFDSISAPGAPSDSGDVRLYANSSKLYFQGEGDASPTEVGSGGGGAGDADTIQLKAANDFSAVNVAPWYTGNNPVPGGGGSIGGTWEISTSNPLINIDGKTNVFHYSNGTSNRKNDYFEIELDVPNYAKGHNLVLQLFYRTVGAEDTDFLFFARDRTADYETTTSSSGALNTITLASATGFAIGDRICIQDSSDARHFRYVTAVSGSDITFSGSAITVGSGDVVISKYFTDELDTIAAENNTTNYEGKIRKWAFQINETTTKIRVGFIYNNTATSTNELFFDQILLSSNQFLQTSSQGQSEYYFVKQQANFWDSSGTSLYYMWDTGMVVAGDGTPALANSKLVTLETFAQPSEGVNVTRILAKQDIILDVVMNAYHGNGGEITIRNSNADVLQSAYAPNSSSAGYLPVMASVKLAKNDYVYFRAHDTGDRAGALTFTATPLVNDVVLLNSQDEIFTDWQDGGTLTIEGITSNPTVPATMYKNKIQYRRNGSNGHFVYQWYQNSAASDAGSGNYLISLPDGLSFDLSKVDVNNTAGTTTAAQWNNEGIGWGSASASWSDADGTGFIVPYDATRFRVFYVRSSEQGIWGSGYFPLNSYTNFSATMDFEIPIAGWTSTFNPVLSMPLVDLGSSTEEYLGHGWGNISGTCPYDVNTVRKNTISKLGTVTDSSTAGWVFQASQQVKVSLSGYCNSTGGDNTMSIVKGPSSIGTAADTDSAMYPYVVAKEFNANGWAAGPSATAILYPGEIIKFCGNRGDALSSDLYAGGVYLVVEKDFSNQNLAHIIKPSVCTITNVLAQSTNNGGPSNDNPMTVPFNTLLGESWFIKSFASSEIKLMKGYYKIKWKVRGRSFETFRSWLYKDSPGSSSQTVANTVHNGMGAYSVTSNMASATSQGECFITILDETEEYGIAVKCSHGSGNSTYGLGNATNWGGPEVYNEWEITKLK